MMDSAALGGCLESLSMHDCRIGPQCEGSLQRLVGTHTTLQTLDLGLNMYAPPSMRLNVYFYSPAALPQSVHGMSSQPDGAVQHSTLHEGHVMKIVCYLLP